MLDISCKSSDRKMSIKQIYFLIQGIISSPRAQKNKSFQLPCVFMHFRLVRCIVISVWFVPHVIRWLCFSYLYLQLLFNSDCSCWLPKVEGMSNYDYVFNGPILLVLCVSIIRLREFYFCFTLRPHEYSGW